MHDKAVKSFVTLVAAVAFVVGIWTIVASEVPFAIHDFQAWAGLAALTIMTIGAQVARLRFSAGQASLSTALIPIVAVVPLFGPAAAVVLAGLSKAVATAFLIKQERLKSVFNTAQAVLAVSLGASLYVALGGPVGYESFKLTELLLPFAALILAYFLTNITLVSLVIAFATHDTFRKAWARIGPVAFANDLASSSLSLFVVFAFIEMGLLGLLIVLLPLVFVHHSYVLYLRLQRQNREVLELLVKTIEAKDPYTSGHSQRVAILSREIGEALRLKPHRIDDLETAALLHDIGKIDVAYSDLITNPSQLSAVERQIIRSHPERGADLLTSLSSLSKAVLDGVRHHHEHYNGNGYPDGLRGEEIPLYARIIMVADTVDAMLSDRPYRSALDVGNVLAELQRFAGRQFDPAILQVLFSTSILPAAANRARSDRTPAPYATVAIPNQHVQAH